MIIAIYNIHIYIYIHIISIYTYIIIQNSSNVSITRLEPSPIFVSAAVEPCPFGAAPLQHRRQTGDLVHGSGGQGAVVERAGVLWRWG